MFATLRFESVVYSCVRVRVWFGGGGGGGGGGGEAVYVCVYVCGLVGAGEARLVWTTSGLDWGQWG